LGPGLRRGTQKGRILRRVGYSEEGVVQIRPFGVEPLDLADFPDAAPLLHLEFALAGFFERVVRFVPDERVATVLAGEARDGQGAVFPERFGSSLVTPI
jgi:hypothetical protein